MPAVREWKIISSGASSDGIRVRAEALILALPVEIGPLVPAVPSSLLRALPERLGPPSRSPIPYGPRIDSLKADSMCVGLWIVWISGTTVAGFANFTR
jgi:hypothetical protein